MIMSTSLHYLIIFAYFFLILTVFQVNCTAVLLGGSNCVNITCEEAEGSQNIVGVEAFLNGESQGPGKYI